MDRISSRIIAPDPCAQGDLSEMLQVEVVDVFDGDGFLADVWDPRRRDWIKRVPFRLAFIDAPEAEQPFGSHTKEYLEQLIGGRTLRLDLIGKESKGYVPIDQYKRMLCMAFLTEDMPVGEITFFMNKRCEFGVLKRARAVTRNVELEMVVNGYAWVLKQYDFDRQGEYFAAQENARDNRRGLWVKEKPEAPWQFKQKLKRRRIASEKQPNFLDRL